jgi:hypothetical protein
MTISSVLQNSFKTELLKGFHSFDTSGATPAGSVFKIALYNSSAALGTTTTAYTTTEELATSASFTCRGCLIYNSSSITGLTTDAAVCSIDFGGDKTVSSGTFTIQFPTNDASDAIIRITS